MTTDCSDVATKMEAEMKYLVPPGTRNYGAPSGAARSSAGAS